MGWVDRRRERERTTGSAQTTPGITWPSPGLCSKAIAGWTLCRYLYCRGEAMWLKPHAGLTGPRKAQCAERARRPPECEDVPPWQGDGPQGDSQVREQQRQLLPVGEVPLPRPPHTANMASKGMEAYQFKSAYSFISLYSCISHNKKVEKQKKRLATYSGQTGMLTQSAFGASAVACAVVQPEPRCLFPCPSCSAQLSLARKDSS